MINKQEIDLKVSEICKDVPELAYPRYKEIIGEVYSCLRENNVYLFVKQGCKTSTTRWINENGMVKPMHIELGVGNYFGTSVLWNLAHELAHLLIFDFGKNVPEPKPWWLIPPQRCASNKEEAQLRLDNEEEAWDVAEEWLNGKFPLEEGERDDFNLCRKLCIDTYKAKVKCFEADCLIT